MSVTPGPDADMRSARRPAEALRLDYLIKAGAPFIR